MSEISVVFVDPHNIVVLMRGVVLVMSHVGISPNVMCGIQWTLNNEHFHNAILQESRFLIKK